MKNDKDKTEYEHNKSQYIRINRVIRRTKVEGFGTRYCIWTQGCSIRCNGCLNKHMWDYEGGYQIRVSDLIDDISCTKEIEGITLLGGEPFDQIDALIELLTAVSGKGLSVIVFTGYVIDEIRTNSNLLCAKCLDYVDLLIDGPYIEEKRDFSRPWIGSENQRYIFLTDRYSEKDLDGLIFTNRYEIRIEESGSIEINGMGDIEVLEKVLRLRGECDLWEGLR